MMSTTFTRAYNDISVTLTSGYTPGSGVLHVSSLDALPGDVPSSSKPLRLSVDRNRDGAKTILIATGRSGLTLTGCAVAEGKTDIPLDAHDVAKVRLSAGYINDLGDAVNALESGSAVDTAVVHIAGAETITGTKTFSAAIQGSVSGTASTITGTIPQSQVVSLVASLASKLDLAGSGAALTGITTGQLGGAPSGILKGSSGAVAAAGAGTDYVTPTGDGSGLTNLNASNLSSGTAPVVRLPVFVASGSSHAAGVVPDPGSSSGSTKYLREDATWAVPPIGTGTVTSVAMTVPGVIFSVSGSPVTTSGTLALSLLTQAANTLFAGPSSGVDAAPTWRALVAADIPSLAGSIISSGTVADARLSGNVPLLNVGNHFSTGQDFIPSASGSAVYIHRLNSGADNGAIWELTIENAGATDTLNFGCSSSTYTTGGALPWVGNNQPFLYYPSQGLKFGTGASSTATLTLDSSRNATFGGTVTATTFSGSGASLTSVPDSALSSNVPLKNAANSFTAAQTVTSDTGIKVVSTTANGGAATLDLAPNNAAGAAGGAAQVNFHDGTALGAQFICSFGNAAGSRYFGFLGGVDRDGNKLPFNLWTKDAGGNLQRAITVNANQTAGTVATIGLAGPVSLTDAVNIAVGTTTGTQIGTSTSQKLGFFAATPIVRPTGGAATASGSYGATEQAMLQAAYNALRNLGLMS